MDAKDSQQQNHTGPRGRCSFNHFSIRAASIAIAALFLLLVGFCVLLSQGPKSGRIMRFLSKISIPATHTFLSGTDYATVHDGNLYLAYGSADTLLAIDTRRKTIRTFVAGMTVYTGSRFQIPRGWRLPHSEGRTQSRSSTRRILRGHDGGRRKLSAGVSSHRHDSDRGGRAYSCRRSTNTASVCRVFQGARRSGARL